MSTIYDVAQRAGVSAMTVSRVLNGKKGVRPETRKRVLKAIEETGYIPNSLARSFTLQKTKTIGLVIADITNPFFTTLARGVENIAAKNQFSVIFCSTDEDREKEALYLEILVRKRVDGIILAPATQKGDSLKSILIKRIPIVLVDRELKSPKNLDLDIVKGDSVYGAYILTKHLLSLGHRRIGIVVGSREISTAEERVQGYKEALIEMGIPVEESLIKFSSYSEEGGYTATKELLQMRERPTAIFGGNNFITVGAITAIKEAELRIPHDVALVSFGDIDFLSQIYPFFTVVTQPAYSMGVIAAELLIRKIEGRDKVKEKREVVLKPELVIRESAGELLTKEVRAKEFCSA
ncbi:MAG: substrate-binding domain-containing protein [Candidatus Atribacteria bacterium]|nr:substrate-binding domain-containing protein [Candidatus Atribacteria bacterium]